MVELAKAVDEALLGLGDGVNRVERKQYRAYQRLRNFACVCPTSTDPGGCRGVVVPGHLLCLAHLGASDWIGYLTTLSPDDDIDHRGTTFSGRCWTNSSMLSVTQPRVDPAPQRSKLLVYLKADAAEIGDTVVVRAGTESLTWTALHCGSNRFARGLTAAGAATDRIVALLLPNSTDLILTVFACYKAGAVPQVLSPRVTPAELDAILELGDPAVVVTEPGSALIGRAGGVAVDDLGTGQSDGDLEPRVATSRKAPTSGGSTGRPKIILSGRPAVTSGFDREIWGSRRGSRR